MFTPVAPPFWRVLPFPSPTDLFSLILQALA